MVRRPSLVIAIGALIASSNATAQEQPAAGTLKRDGYEHFCFNPAVICDPPGPMSPAKSKPNPFEVFLPTRPKLLPQSGKPELPLGDIKHSGETRLTLCVEPTGDATDIAVQSSSGDVRLDQAAQEYVSRADFTPSRWLGRPIRKCGHAIVIAWKLDGD